MERKFESTGKRMTLSLSLIVSVKKALKKLATESEKTIASIIHG